MLACFLYDLGCVKEFVLKEHLVFVGPRKKHFASYYVVEERAKTEDVRLVAIGKPF